MHNISYSTLRRNFLTEIPAYLQCLVYGGIILPNHSATKP